jgi:hypothetical protein
VTSARRNVWARFEGSGEWATPVLFLRTPDGNIFDVGAFPGGDSRTSALQQEVIAATMSNLDVDLSQLRTILATGSREVIKRLPAWLTDRWSSADRSAEELYQQAVEYMQAERWADANRFFKLCNDRAPGYRNIGALWQESRLQERLAEHYRRLVSAYAEQKWQRVVELATIILNEAPAYKDTTSLHDHALRMMGMTPRPTNLPASAPARPGTPPPSSLSPVTRPPTLPSGAAPANSENATNRTDAKPPSLPGRSSA